MTKTPVEAPSPSGKWEAVMLAVADPIGRYWAMFRAHNENDELEDQYFAAFDALNEHEPASCRDVVRKFVAMFSEGGFPDEDRKEALIEQAKRALEREV